MNSTSTDDSFLATAIAFARESLALSGLVPPDEAEERANRHVLNELLPGVRGNRPVDGALDAPDRLALLEALILAHIKRQQIAGLAKGVALVQQASNLSERFLIIQNTLAAMCQQGAEAIQALKAKIVEYQQNPPP